MKDAVLFGGRPTAPQVRVLLATFAERAEGDVISYASIADAINESTDSGRFRVVVEAWRKTLRKEKNVELETVRGAGFRILHAAERTRAGIRGVARGIRQISRGGKRLREVPTEKLTDPERNTHMHVSRVVDAIEIDARAGAMKIKAHLGPTKSNPRIGP